MLTQAYNFWHTYGADIQNGAVVLSAIAAFLVIRDSRRVAKRRGTLDLIFQQEADKELIDARQAFIALKGGNTKLSIYGDEAHRFSDEAKAIRKVLNLHELTAVAIQEGVIDERVYRRWFNLTFVEDYKCTKDYIEAVRLSRKNPAIFAEFETLAVRWHQEHSKWYAKPGWFRRKWNALIRLYWA